MIRTAPHRTAVCAILLAFTALACDSRESRSAKATNPASGDAVSGTAALREERIQFSAARPEAAPPEELTALSTSAGGVAQSASPPAPPPGPAQLPTAAGRDETTPLIIRTGAATLQVDSLETGLAALQRVVQAIPGAYVANTSLESGEQQTRRATLVVKVPAAQFDRLVAGLTPLGKVEAVNVSAEDVTEEFVDVTARVENARRLESRLVDLLTRRTGKLEEVLAVERELARVREEIERYAGRLRYLRTRAALSTLSVTLHERMPVLGAQPGSNPLADALRGSWRNFVGFIAGFIELLGVLVPLGVLAFGVWLIVQRVRRARRVQRERSTADESV